RDHLAYPSIDARAALCRDVRPATRIDIIPAAGHWVQYEQPAAFNEALLSFEPEASRLQRV
ncbi:MAG: alpha/beta hydrolase, partial [Pseudorhodoplanes sp.]|nr:alpha/beta hydrolase [Pseudorhodoplanes sp.]